MGLETLTIRPFRSSDSLALEGAALDVPTIGNTALVDGEIAAYAGVHHVRGRDWAFFHVADSPAGRLLKNKAPLFIHRIVRDAVVCLQEQGFSDIFVLCDDAFPKARAWLMALGFVKAERMPFDLIAMEVQSGAEVWVKRKGE